MWITDHVDEELSAALAEVRRFASRRVSPLTERHERPIDSAALASLLREAEELGLASASGGLWADADRGVGASVALLSTVAEHCAGVALALHQRALAARVAERAGIESAVDLVVAHGHYGVGRSALADWLAGDSSIDSEALLADVYGVERPRILSAAAVPEALLVPIWQRGLELWVIARPEVVVLPHAHGLKV